MPSDHPDSGLGHDMVGRIMLIFGDKQAPWPAPARGGRGITRQNGTARSLSDFLAPATSRSRSWPPA
jgi:hypothetical protein